MASATSPGSMSESKKAAEPWPPKKVAGREAQKDGTTNCQGRGISEERRAVN